MISNRIAMIYVFYSSGIRASVGVFHGTLDALLRVAERERKRIDAISASVKFVRVWSADCEFVAGEQCRWSWLNGR